MDSQVTKSELPWDLVEEILCRVPATSSQRLRCICKRWNDLISDRNFAKKHLDKAEKQFMNSTCELSQFDPQVKVKKVFHCDGLLLCHLTEEEDITRLVVWNPCTGQTKRIQPSHRVKKFDTNNPRYHNYFLGSYQENKSHHNSYKVLRYTIGLHGWNKEFEIYDINSNSWRILDITLDCSVYLGYSVSLKGKSYWIARYFEEEPLGVFLMRFDYTTERLDRLCLPYRYPSYGNVILSVVREDKLSVLIQRKSTSKAEIWVINKIGETKVVSWSMVLAVDFNKPDNVIWHFGGFFLDEEKKVLSCFELTYSRGKNPIYIVGEENQVRHTDFKVSSQALWFTYVPSLTQI